MSPSLFSGSPLPALGLIGVLTVLTLLGIGLYTLLMVRNLIKVIIALQLIGKSAMLALIVASRYGAAAQLNLGQSLALTVIVADTVVAVIGLALAVRIRQGALDIHAFSKLKG